MMSEVVEEKEEKKKKKKIDNVEEVLRNEGVLISGQTLVERKYDIISVSPAFDIMVGGGIKEGSLWIPTGPPKCGKTSSALQLAANAQQTPFEGEVGKRKVFISNIEGRLQDRDLLGIKGLNLNPEQFQIIGSTPGNILTAEKYIEYNEQLINEKRGCIFIIDSFSQLCTEGEMEAEIGDRYRADAPLLLARFCRRICNILPINKNIVIGITHQIANQGKGHSQWSEASGQKIQYQVDTKTKAWTQSWVAGETEIGKEINWTCLTSSLGPPGRKCLSRFRYNYGLDKEAELVEICCDLGLIKKGGAWYSIGTEKFQGLEKTRQHLVDKPELYNDLWKQVKEMMNLK